MRLLDAQGSVLRPGSQGMTVRGGSRDRDRERHRQRERQGQRHTQRGRRGVQHLLEVSTAASGSATPPGKDTPILWMRKLRLREIQGHLGFAQLV